ncbi:unnamed protein product [Sphenostylis stenocarpa]|uniref:Uncharacterized protein n=1 Tax=Sphenostylis stenocarpa TaxID=92480 RepID=A0AA86RWH1_9FABA|nr:unnamed protein product [Sphenostylis stenocarpa]
MALNQLRFPYVSVLCTLELLNNGFLHNVADRPNRDYGPPTGLKPLGSVGVICGRMKKMGDLRA